MYHSETPPFPVQTSSRGGVPFRIAVVPPFSKLRHFHEGRGFKQWTGDDSKALMKVNIAIHSPVQVLELSLK